MLSLAHARRARALLALGLWLCAHAALAQGRAVELDRFTPAALPADGLALSRPDVLRANELGLGLVLDYARDPLTLRAPGSPRAQALGVVRDQLVLHALASLGVWERVSLSLALRVHTVLGGEALPERSPLAAADGAGLGDLRLGARWLAYRNDRLALGAQLGVGLPLARWVDGAQHYRGEHGASVSPGVLAELRHAGIVLSGELGLRLRESTRLAGMHSGSELAYGLGVSAPLVPQLDLRVEGYGASDLQRFGKARSTAFEALLGVAWFPVAELRVDAGVGPGLSAALGTPALRGVLRVSYRSQPAPPPAAADADADGIPDARDRCPLDAEDHDAHEDEDGCSEPDDDWDGVPDERDRCPMQAEDANGVQDEDGCADAALGHPSQP